MILKKLYKNSSNYIENNPWILLFIYTFIIFSFCRGLFNSYFSADEWYHFTQYLPLINKPDGFFSAIFSPFIKTAELSGGQHVNPIASAIFFLNTKFFGMNFEPYAFMSLFLHSVNSFLIFFLLSIFLKKDNYRIPLAIIGGLFFALAPTPLHTITGAAPFYGENILSVTLVLFSLIFLKIAYIKKDRKYLIISLLFLFLAPFSKETSAYLFLVWPIVVFFESRVFSLKYVFRIFITCLVCFLIVRFVIPGLLNQKISSREAAIDTHTVVSQDLSIYKNLPSEIAIRSITFPLRMISTVFVPRQVIVSLAEWTIPILNPLPPDGDRTGAIQFKSVASNYVVVYFISLVFLYYFLIKIKDFFRNKQKEEFKIFIIGLSIIVFSSLMLVFIIFSFPRWGYDYFFDSRHYYHPTVGAALIFPILLFSLSKSLSYLFNKRFLMIIFLALFSIWLLNNMIIFDKTFKEMVNRYDSDRKEVLKQLKTFLPSLPQDVVIYMETDNSTIYGPNLPFNTSVAQAISVYYHDVSPLPDSFYSGLIFDGKAEGYLKKDGQGFGYFITKEKLLEAIKENKFKVEDIFAFYYKGKEVEVIDISDKIRKQLSGVI